MASTATSSGVLFFPDSRAGLIVLSEPFAANCMSEHEHNDSLELFSNYSIPLVNHR